MYGFSVLNEQRCNISLQGPVKYAKTNRWSTLATLLLCIIIKPACALSSSRLHTNHTIIFAEWQGPSLAGLALPQSIKIYTMLPVGLGVLDSVAKQNAKKSATSSNKRVGASELSTFGEHLLHTPVAPRSSCPRTTEVVSESYSDLKSEHPKRTSCDGVSIEFQRAWGSHDIVASACANRRSTDNP